MLQIVESCINVQ